ncbi:MAG: hypothetical protein M1835_001785 [Candelina submexicana]|nr:MAG: hypothetical protein M1835_001785 [Candelina submexicana]
MEGAVPPGYMLVPVQGNGTANTANQLVPYQPPPPPQPAKEPPKEPPMVPGKTYITVPSGHSKPAFVRKKGKNVGWGFGLLADAFATPRRDIIQVASKPKEEPKPEPPQVCPPYYYLISQQQQQSQITHSANPLGEQQSQAQQQLPAPAPAQAAPNPPPPAAPQQPAPVASAAPTAPATEVKAPGEQSNLSIARHQCFYCHKVRSAGYHRRHPVLPGQVMLPTVCRKCERQRTPSGDEDEKKTPRNASAKEESKEISHKVKKNRKAKKEAARKYRCAISKSDEESLDRSQNDGPIYRSRRLRSYTGVRYFPKRANSREIGPNRPRVIRRGNGTSEGEETEWVRSRLRIKHRSRSEESRGMTPLQDSRRANPRDGTHVTRRTYLAAPPSCDSLRTPSRRRSRSGSSSRDPVHHSDSEQGMASSDDEIHIIRHTMVREPSFEMPRASGQDRSRARSRSTEYDERDARRYNVIQSRPISQAYSPSRWTEDRTREYQETRRRVASYPDSYRLQHDSDFDEESRSRSRHRSQSRAYGTPTRQGSYIASSHHTSTPYPKRHQDYRGQHDNRPQGTYSGHIHSDRRSPESQTQHESALPKRPRSISRPVRVSSALETQRHWDSDTADAGGPRVQFVRDSSTRRNTISDRESDIAGRSRQRRRLRAADLDGYRHEAEDEYASTRRSAPSIIYRAPSPPRTAAASWKPQPRYLTAEPHYSETEISEMFRDARIAYSPSPSPRGRSRSRGGSSISGHSVSRNRSSSARPPSYVSQSGLGRSNQDSARYAYARSLQRRSTEWSVSSANTERPMVRFEHDEGSRFASDAETSERQVVARGRDSKGEYVDIVETVTLDGREEIPNWGQSESWEHRGTPVW